MLNVDQIEEWLGQEVVDSAGERVGKLDEVFYSAANGEATFAAVKSGILGRRSELVPLAGASVGRDYLRLAYTGEQIEQAGSEVSVKDNLDRGDARRLAELFGVELAHEDEFHGASTLRARREASERAHAQADELEREAQLRASEAESARGLAQNAEQDAAVKAESSEQARADAESARAEAERLTAERLTD